MARFERPLSLVIFAFSCTIIRHLGGLHGAAATTPPPYEDSTCRVSLVYQILPPPPALAYPPNPQFFYGLHDGICFYSAYTNVSYYLDSVVWQVYPDSAAFSYGDRACGPDEIMWAAEFQSPEQALSVRDDIFEGARQVALNYYCQHVRGAYGMTIKSEVLPGYFVPECYQVNLTVLCEPPPVPFPNCNCNTSAGITALRVATNATREPGRRGDTTTYCFNVTSQPAELAVKSTCSSKTLVKAEIWADDSQRRLVKGVRLTRNGGKPTWTAASWGPSYENTLKITPLNWSMSDAIGGQICIEIKNEIQLIDVCIGGACYISLFNDKKNCCPVYRAELLPPPKIPGTDYYYTGYP